MADAIEYLKGQGIMNFCRLLWRKPNRLTGSSQQMFKAYAIILQIIVLATH